jgi:hypothetical protein
VKINGIEIYPIWFIKHPLPKFMAETPQLWFSLPKASPEVVIGSNLVFKSSCKKPERFWVRDWFQNEMLLVLIKCPN